MSGQGPKFVNNQFNSPINLYSKQSIQETLDRQTQVLANGAVGIDFNQLAKPANLQNSAVLRMLEEEEARQRGGQPGSLKRVAWPPLEDQDINFVEQSPVQAKTRGIGDFPSYESSPVSGPSPQPPSTIQQQAPAPNRFVPTSPSPVSPGGTLRQPPQFQQVSAPKGWAPVTPPAVSPQPQQNQQQPPWRQQPQAPQTPQSLVQVPAWSQPATPQQSAQAPPSWSQSQPQQQQQQQSNQQREIPPLQQQKQPVPVYPSAAATPAPVFEPPPSTITLRQEAPISQVPAPVYHAQPAATKVPISGTMRGDMKWPPASVKAQFEAENRARVELAKGPAVRPRRVNKDYSGFFAQHALNSTYPGYRVPPGTQYFTPAYHQ